MKRHPFDRYTFDSGETLRLTRDDVLVKMDPEPEKSGFIYFPDGAIEHIYMTGTVLAFGYIKEMKQDGTEKTRPVRPFPIPDLEVGDKCCFVRYRRWQDTNKLMREMFDDDIITLKPEDLLFVFTGKIKLG